MQSIELAERNFGDGQSSQPAELRALNTTISGMNNDALLLALKGSGQAYAFGDLRNFLTQLKFLSAAAHQGRYQFTDQMAEDLRRARTVADTACGSATSAGAASNAATQGDAATAARGTYKSLELGSREKPVLTLAQREFLQQSFQFGTLARLFTGIAGAAALALLAHYGLLVARVLRRNRRICEVPAELHCMMEAVPGRITVLGRYGCVFTPDAPDLFDPLAGISAGTYCTVRPTDAELGAKLMRDLSDDCSLLFTTPLDLPQMRDLLAASEIPARYDFSVIKGTSRATRRFGIGRMPQA
ncbi:hypothetical protein AB2B41_13990 [Marimonas sp. MJW-29]|uniref:Uncharacterized protein n=1 Tax=Sulfitobacter sediminis TaxID=3234186 RepID=A0ABV3RP20_9RHOB